MIAWYRGEFDKALAGLTSAADHADIDAREQETRWFMPNEPVASVYTHLAAARFVIGDHTGAQRAMAQAQKRVERLDFPQGPYSHAYARSYETWMNIEAGRLDHAADIVAAMTEQARRYHFAGWMLIAETQRASVDALSLLATGSPDAQVLQPHIAAMTMFIESWRTVEMKMFLTFYDSVLARLLAAAGRPDAARDRLDTALGLAADTDVHFYDAELLRLRAHTEQAGEARRAGLAAARELAIRQGAVIFELRSATDDFTLSGDRNVLTAAVNRFPVDSTWPELTRARALLG
jgi:tetratricopeptide (TPR) repeat protein